MSEMNADYFRQLQVQKHRKAIEKVSELFFEKLHKAILVDRDSLIENTFYFTIQSNCLTHDEINAFVSFLKLKGFTVSNQGRDFVVVKL
jgi:hypothetical protein